MEASMADDLTQRAIDAEENQKTYQSVMRVSAEIGVPFSLALTMFFTNLVLANGVGAALIAAIVVYVFVFFVVKAFFSH
ncbi:MAG: hypothetical protein AAFR21_11445 [Pseudomonadota bacterium]